MKRSGFKRKAPAMTSRDPDRVRDMPVGMQTQWITHAEAKVMFPMPKSEPQRNPFLLAMARGERCTLMVPGVCSGDCTTVVACHSNLGEHAKAGARKADDQWHAWGCSECHRWLDQGRATYEKKRDIFMGAHARMVGIWHDIVAGMQTATPRERAAAQWAIDRVTKKI